MKRRDFLHPRHLVRRAGHVVGALDELRAAEAATEIQGIPLVRVGRRAMATDFEVLFPFGQPEALPAGEAALDEVDRLEAQLTVYRDSSEISVLNRLAFHRPIRVEDRLFALLLLAARLSRETEGAFDPTTGPLVKVWGFFRRQGRLPSEHELAEVMPRVGMRHVVLDAYQQTVRYLSSGMEVNLGSIGKGYALDRVAELLRRGWTFSSALLHGGHSSVYALGPAPGQPRGWRIGIRHPWDPDRRLGVVWLQDRALGTSAATHLHLEYKGRKLGHILDPRTGWPAEGMASATAIAPTAAEADALATAFFILGIDRARAYCAAHPGIGAVLLPQGVEAVPVVCGLGPDEYAPCP